MFLSGIFFVSLQGRPEETGEAFEDQEASPNGPTFNPALYIQRYLMVADTVTDVCDQAIKEGRDSFKVSFDSSFQQLSFLVWSLVAEKRMFRY